MCRNTITELIEQLHSNVSSQTIFLNPIITSFITRVHKSQHPQKNKIVQISHKEGIFFFSMHLTYSTMPMVILDSLCLHQITESCLLTLLPVRLSRNIKITPFIKLLRSAHRKWWDVNDNQTCQKPKVSSALSTGRRVEHFLHSKRGTNRTGRERR